MYLKICKLNPWMQRGKLTGRRCKGNIKISIEDHVVSLMWNKFKYIAGIQVFTESYLLGYNSVHPFESQPIFVRNTSCSSLGLKCKLCGLWWHVLPKRWLQRTARRYVLGYRTLLNPAVDRYVLLPFMYPLMNFRVPKE